MIVTERPPQICPLCESRLVVAWGLEPGDCHGWIRIPRADVWSYSDLEPRRFEAESDTYQCLGCYRKYRFLMRR